MNRMNALNVLPYLFLITFNCSLSQLGPYPGLYDLQKHKIMLETIRNDLY